MNNNQFNYGPTTPHIQNQMNTGIYNNLNKAFMHNTPLIDANNYNNKNQLLHNNLGEKIFNERVVEYKIIMSSLDRDRQKFPSPFHMQVSFGNANVYPNIEESMTNVKYVTLNSIIVPKTFAVDTTKIDIGNSIHDILPLHSIFGDKKFCDDSNPEHLFYSIGIKPFLLVKIKELDDSHLMGTSPMYQRNTFMMIPDQRVGDSIIYKPKRSSIIYPNSQLKNLNMFTLTILDECGKEIYLVNENGNKIINQNINSNVNLNYNQYVSTYEDNKYVKHTDKTMNIIYDFTFGVIENELNTLTSYNKT
jgi:hypothetical protein